MRWCWQTPGLVVGSVGAVDAAQVVAVCVVEQLVEEAIGLLRRVAELLEKQAPTSAVGIEQAEQAAFVLDGEQAVAQATVELAVDAQVRKGGEVDGCLALAEAGEGCRGGWWQGCQVGILLQWAGSDQVQQGGESGVAVELVLQALADVLGLFDTLFGIAGNKAGNQREHHEQAEDGDQGKALLVAAHQNSR